MALSRLRSIIAPSMLSSDFACLASEAQRMVSDGADWLHMDVMDGHFVPNISIGMPVIAALRKHTSAFLDCHIMVSEPEKWIEGFAKAGASQITFHIEATADPSALITSIKSKGMRAGVALKPATPASAVLPFLSTLDMVLVMTVEPGFGGQKFMAGMMPKVRELRAASPSLDIQVDGGLDLTNVDAAAEAGANVIVAGTSVFGAPDCAAAIAGLRAAVDAALAKAEPTA